MHHYETIEILSCLKKIRQKIPLWLRKDPSKLISQTKELNEAKSSWYVAIGWLDDNAASGGGGAHAVPR